MQTLGAVLSVAAALRPGSIASDGRGGNCGASATQEHERVTKLQRHFPAPKRTVCYRGPQPNDGNTVGFPALGLPIVAALRAPRRLRIWLSRRKIISGFHARCCGSAHGLRLARGFARAQRARGMPPSVGCRSRSFPCAERRGRWVARSSACVTTCGRPCWGAPMWLRAHRADGGTTIRWPGVTGGARVKSLSLPSLSWPVPPVAAAVSIRPNNGAVLRSSTGGSCARTSLAAARGRTRYSAARRRVVSLSSLMRWRAILSSDHLRDRLAASCSARVRRIIGARRFRDGSVGAERRA